jgi:hypothetical protein
MAVLKVLLCREGGKGDEGENSVKDSPRDLQLVQIRIAARPFYST